MSKTFLISNGDVVLSSATSRPLFVADRDKLKQDLAEATSISIQPNGFGFGLEDVIAQLADPIVLRADLSRRVRDGLDAMKRLQDQFQRVSRPPEERISRLVKIDVLPIQSDATALVSKTSYSFRFDIVTAAGEAIVGGSGVITGQ